MEAETSSVKFPDPATLTPAQRSEAIHALRGKVLRKEPVTREEIQYATRLLTSTREHDVANAGKRKSSTKVDSTKKVKARKLFSKLD